jgi:hypothetical protein
MFRTKLCCTRSASPQFATGAQGSGVVAVPSRSLFQSNVAGLRMVMEVAWGLRHPSGLAWLDNITAW